MAHKNKHRQNRIKTRLFEVCVVYIFSIDHPLSIMLNVKVASNRNKLALGKVRGFYVFRYKF